jgi:hypothetical protein
VYFPGTDAGGQLASLCGNFFHPFKLVISQVDACQNVLPLQFTLSDVDTVHTLQGTLSLLAG